MLSSTLPAAILLLTASAAAGNECPATTFDVHWKTYGKTCFARLPDVLDDRAGAAAACQATQPGATLPSLHSAQQNRWFLQHVVQQANDYHDIWLGLSRLSGSTMLWQDGSPVDFTNWLGSEQDGSGDCVYMDYFRAQWHDHHCFRNLTVVCQYTP